MNEQERKERLGREARNILDSEAFMRAMERIDALALDMMKRTSPADTDKLVSVWGMLQARGVLEKELRSYLATLIQIEHQRKEENDSE